MTTRTRRILVGYDGSASALRALDAAADLAGYGSTLTVVSVASPGNEDVDARLSEARERLLGRHVAARYLDPAGDPAETLLGTAREVGADLVVVGRSEAVGASVARGASCDVLVVR